MATTQTILGKARIRVTTLWNLLGLAHITYAVPPANSARIFRVDPLVYPYTVVPDNRVFYVFKPKILRS